MLRGELQKFIVTTYCMEQVSLPWTGEVYKGLIFVLCFSESSFQGELCLFMQ